MNLELDVQPGVKALGIRYPVRAWVVAGRDGPLKYGLKRNTHAATSFSDHHVHEVFLFPDSVCTCGKCNLDPNISLLHELVHAKQAENMGLMPFEAREVFATAERVFGYATSPHEREARELSERLAAEGIRVVR